MGASPFNESLIDWELAIKITPGHEYFNGNKYCGSDKLRASIRKLISADPPENRADLRLLVEAFVSKQSDDPLSFAKRLLTVTQRCAGRSN